MNFNDMIIKENKETKTIFVKDEYGNECNIEIQDLVDDLREHLYNEVTNKYGKYGIYTVLEWSDFFGAIEKIIFEHAITEAVPDIDPDILAKM